MRYNVTMRTNDLHNPAPVYTPKRFTVDADDEQSAIEQAKQVASKNMQACGAVVSVTQADTA